MSQRKAIVPAISLFFGFAVFSGCDRAPAHKSGNGGAPGATGATQSDDGVVGGSSSTLISTQKTSDGTGLQVQIVERASGASYPVTTTITCTQYSANTPLAAQGSLTGAGTGGAAAAPCTVNIIDASTIDGASQAIGSNDPNSMQNALNAMTNVTGGTVTFQTAPQQVGDPVALSLNLTTNKGQTIQKTYDSAQTNAQWETLNKAGKSGNGITFAADSTVGFDATDSSAIDAIVGMPASGGPSSGISIGMQLGCASTCMENFSLEWSGSGTPQVGQQYPVTNLQASIASITQGSSAGGTPDPNAILSSLGQLGGGTSGQAAAPTAVVAGPSFILSGTRQFNPTTGYIKFDKVAQNYDEEMVVELHLQDSAGGALLDVTISSSYLSFQEAMQKGFSKMLSGSGSSQ